MRPSRRFLGIALAALAISVLAVVWSAIPTEAATGVWIILAILLVLDFALSPGRRSLQLQVNGPDEVFSGESVNLTLDLTTSGTILPRQLDGRFDLAEGLGGSGHFFMQRSGDIAKGSIAIEGIRRGTFPISALWLCWRSRFGLLEFTPKFVLDRVLKVVPNIRPIASGEINVKVQSDLWGMKENVARGEGSEFHQLREFTTGMDTRTIDWKRSARMRDLVAKETRAERNHQIIICLDNGYLMREEIDGLPKIDHAVNSALALAWAAGLGGDLVGLYSFDAQPRLYLPPQAARTAFPRLRSHMAALEYKSVESNHTLAMAHLNGQLRRRSLLVIFSDFVDTVTAELLVENIAILNKHHVVIFVALRNPMLEERTRSASNSMTGVAEAVAASQLVRERRIVLDNLARLGVVCIDTVPGALTPRLVSAYLEIKARELI